MFIVETSRISYDQDIIAHFYRKRIVSGNLALSDRIECHQLLAFGTTEYH